MAHKGLKVIEYVLFELVFFCKLTDLGYFTVFVFLYGNEAIGYSTRIKKCKTQICIHRSQSFDDEIRNRAILFYLHTRQS